MLLFKGHQVRKGLLHAALCTEWHRSMACLVDSQQWMDDCTLFCASKWKFDSYAKPLDDRACTQVTRQRYWPSFWRRYCQRSVAIVSTCNLHGHMGWSAVERTSECVHGHDPKLCVHTFYALITLFVLLSKPGELVRAWPHRKPMIHLGLNVRV